MDSNTGIKMEVPYFQIPNEIFEADINKHEMLVYFYLARCGNNGSRAFPSYNKIAEKCKISRRTAIDAVKSLEAKRIIKKDVRYNFEREQHYSNTYIVEHDLRGSAGHALGSVADAPGSAGYAPYKELDYKEPKKKNQDIYLNLPIYAHPYLEIYNDHFYEILDKEHMRVTHEQLDFIMKGIKEIAYFVEEEDYERGVMKHFNNLPESNNGNIIAFLHASMRYFEVDLS